MRLELTPREQEYLEWTRGLTTDAAGNLTLVGLTVEEANWYRDYLLHDSAGPSPWDQYRRECARFEELHARYEFFRNQAVARDRLLRAGGS